MTTSPAILLNNQNRVQLRKTASDPMQVYRDAVEAAALCEWRKRLERLQKSQLDFDVPRAARFGATANRMSRAVNKLDAILRSQVVNNFSE